MPQQRCSLARRDPDSLAKGPLAKSLANLIPATLEQAGGARGRAGDGGADRRRRTQQLAPTQSLPASREGARAGRHAHARSLPRPAAAPSRAALRCRSTRARAAAQPRGGWRAGVSALRGVAKRSSFRGLAPCSLADLRGGDGQAEGGPNGQAAEVAHHGESTPPGPRAATGRLAMRPGTGMRRHRERERPRLAAPRRRHDVRRTHCYGATRRRERPLALTRLGMAKAAPAGLRASGDERLGSHRQLGIVRLGISQFLANEAEPRAARCAKKDSTLARSAPPAVAETMSSSLLAIFEQYQKARVQFVQAVAEAATRPQNIDTMQNAGVMQLLRPLLLDNVRPPRAIPPGWVLRGTTARTLPPARRPADVQCQLEGRFGLCTRRAVWQAAHAVAAERGGWATGCSRGLGGYQVHARLRGCCGPQAALQGALTVQRRPGRKCSQPSTAERPAGAAAVLLSPLPPAHIASLRAHPVPTPAGLPRSWSRAAMPDLQHLRKLRPRRRRSALIARQPAITPPLPPSRLLRIPRRSPASSRPPHSPSAAWPTTRTTSPRRWSRMRSSRSSSTHSESRT